MKISTILLVLTLLALVVFAVCPSADLNGDFVVNFVDFALADSDVEAVTNQWLEEKPDVAWAEVNEPAFAGWVGVTEVTNKQYCCFLNARMKAGTIVVNEEGLVCNLEGIAYLNLHGVGMSIPQMGITQGGSSRIEYDTNDGLFKVDVAWQSFPVTFVSWYGAEAFAQFYGWKLPTENEWEAIADYDGSFTYGFGNILKPYKCNYYYSEHPYGVTDVNSHSPAGYGVCDMSGNVCEWVANYDINGTELLGGHWWTERPYDLEVSSRTLYALPSRMDFLIGFRVCK